MKYAALLRGINVGGRRKVEMSRLKSILESLGYTNVVTYLNSGNTLFETGADQAIDVAYLFHEVDTESTIADIPVRREYADLIYVKGAIVWHILRKNYGKSQLNKLIGQDIYQLMTVRNVNTARFLAGEKKK